MYTISQLATHTLAPLALLLPALACLYRLRLLQLELRRDEIRLQQAAREEQLLDLGLRMLVVTAVVGALLALYAGLSAYALAGVQQNALQVLVAQGVMPLCLWLAGGVTLYGLGQIVKSAVAGEGLNELYLAARFSPADDSLLELRQIGELLRAQRSRTHAPAAPLRARPTSSPHSPLRAVPQPGTGPRPDAG